MTDGDSSRGTWATDGWLHPWGGGTLAKSGRVKDIRQLSGELRGIRRHWGRREPEAVVSQQE